MEIKEYFEHIQKEVKNQYDFASIAKAKGLDPVDKVETPIAVSLAEKAVGLISTIYPQLDGKIVERINELEKQYGQLDTAVAFKIAEEIARERFCKFESLLQAIEAGVRVGFSYITLGVVSSPLEGFTGLKLGKTREGKEYFTAFFSGPIRSAGTTASCMVLMLIDYLRETFGFAKYDPDEEEIKRYVTENYDYHERVNNLQYLPTEEEILFLARNIPIEISGDPTEDREVSNYKDLKRIDTNFIRGGMCLIFSEGLAQKAQKGLRLLKATKEKGFVSTGWDFLDEYITKHKKKAKGTGDNTPTYIKDLVAGRPVYSHPSRSGGFRFRYGRTRTSGFSATAVHPATMAMSDSFLSFGNQLKIEKPTKGCAVSVCDEIDGPIVKLKNGSIKKIRDFEEAKKLYKDVKEIVYLGDILISFGDVANRNYEMLKPGYVEEWWELELKKSAGENLKVEKFNIDFNAARQISEKYSVPLHPKFIYYWNEISYEQFLGLVDWFARGRIIEKRFILPYNKAEQERFTKGKRALELLGCPHDAGIENIVLNEEDSAAILFNLGINSDSDDLEAQFDTIMDRCKAQRPILEIINSLAKAKIKDKSGTFIGARMGRPEKSKLRKLTGSPHVMFPVGEEGGRLRSFQAAVESGKVSADFSIFFCEGCKEETVYPKCERCGNLCKKIFYSMDEDRNYLESQADKANLSEYKNLNLDIRHYFDAAKKKLGLRNEEIPVVKGVRGTSNKSHSCENLAKGLLRAKYNLNVNKDGTIRYDMTEMAITHFKPKEIGTSIEKLKELGYVKDAFGKPIENDEQILELFPHDVILPACPETLDERADDVFLRIAGFIDDELEKLYGMERMFNAKTKNDLLGTLVVCIAPHICTASVGRLIGFSKTQTLLASPFMHAAMRRDCFAYDSYIPIKENGKFRIVKIGDYVEKLNPQRVVDGWGTKEKKAEGIFTTGFDAGIKEIKVNNFTKHSLAKILEIRTALGKKIKVTENHKFIVDGREKRANKLEIGDKIPLPYKLRISPNNLKEINFLEHVNEKGFMIRGIKSILEKRIGKEELFELAKRKEIGRRRFDNYFRRDSFPAFFVLSLNKNILNEIFDKGKIGYNRDRISLPIRIGLSDAFLEVVGLFIAEGYARSIQGEKGLNQVYIASLEKEIKDRIIAVMKNELGLSPTEKKQDRVTFSSKLLYLLFTKILECGHGAHNKRIPPIFLNLPLEKLACVLRGYFEGDGSAEKARKKICCDSVSEGLLHDLEFCLSRFGIFAKRYEYEKEPGNLLRQFYIRKNREIPKFKITKLIIGSDFADKFRKIGFLSKRKRKILESYKKIKPYGMEIEYDENFVYDPIISIKEQGEEESYCLNVDSKQHSVIVNSILSKQCDGDEAAAFLLMDLLLNFSRKFLPAHRGGTQDAPLVLNVCIRAGDVDDQILDLEVEKYPLELYEMAEQGKHSSEVKVENVKSRLKFNKDPFSNIAFTHGCFDINATVLNSSYKTLPTMHEKVEKMMQLDEKIRAVDIKDIARLIIERHFIRDTRGNLRKFSMQVFRCVACNSKYRRPPLAGKCSKCGGRLIFTISEGSILKYMQPALDIARKYEVSQYLLESLELNQMYIESIFGKEKEKQEGLGKWF